MSVPTVLKSCRLVLSLAQLGNKKRIQIIRWKIPKILSQLLFLLPLITFPVNLVWYCVDEHFKLNKIAGAMGLTFGAIQMIFIYLSLVVNNDLIVKTFDTVQAIINKRTVFISPNKEPIIIAQFFIGCAISQDALEIYRRKEAENRKLCRTQIICLFVAEGLLCGVNYIQPVIYAVVGSPRPDAWQLSFPTPHMYFH